MPSSWQSLSLLSGVSATTTISKTGGPHGSYEGEGRDFLYPLTLIDETSTKRKRRNKADEDDPLSLSTGRYAFGANRLHIIKALDELVSYLEREHGLRL